MAGVLGRFCFATASEKQLKQRKHSKKHFFLVVGLEEVVFRRELPRKSKNYEPTQLNTFSSDPTPKLKTNMVKPWIRRFHFIESDSDTG